MNQDLNTIGKRISYRLIVLDMNKTQLAAKICRSRQVISDWITDKKVPSTGVLPSLGRVLGCSLEWLLEGDTESV